MTLYRQCILIAIIGILANIWRAIYHLFLSPLLVTNGTFIEITYQRARIDRSILLSFVFDLPAFSKVEYSTSNWVEQNAYAMPPSIAAVLSASSNALVRRLSEVSSELP